MTSRGRNCPCRASKDRPQDRFSGVALIAVGHMRVRVDRLHAVGRPAGIDHALLPDDDERSLGHDPAEGCGLGGCHLRQVTADVQRAGGPC